MDFSVLQFLYPSYGAAYGIPLTELLWGLSESSEWHTVSPLDAVVIITDVAGVAVVISMTLALRPEEVIPLRWQGSSYRGLDSFKTGNFRNPEINTKPLQQGPAQHPGFPGQLQRQGGSRVGGREDRALEQEGLGVHYCPAEDSRKTNRAPTAPEMNKHNLCGVPLLSN